MVEVMAGLLGSMVAALELGFVIGPKRQRRFAAEAVLRPMFVDADGTLGPEPTIVARPGAVVVEPMVAGVPAELVEPKEVALGVFAEVAVPTVLVVGSPFVMGVSTGSGLVAVVVLGLVTMLAEFVGTVAVHLSVPKMAEPDDVVETVVPLVAESKVAEADFDFVLEADSSSAGFEGSKHLWEPEAVPGSEWADALPMEVAWESDLRVVPGAGLELYAIQQMTVAGFASVLQSKPSSGRTRAAEKASSQRFPLGVSLAKAAAEILALWEPKHAVRLL